jgi:PhzF family phenazine biosynthesis protein
MTIGLYDVFAAHPFSGNQAAVVRGAALDDRELVMVASELLLPETVAVEEREGIPTFRFATSDGLISRCGHGALAAVADKVLGGPTGAKQQHQGLYQMDGKTAEWHVQTVSENCVAVSLAWPEMPTKCAQLPRQMIMKALRLQAHDCDDTLPFAIYNSGNRNGIVPLKSLSVLEKASPDYHALERLFANHRLADLHLYVLTAHDTAACSYDLHCRNVFPYGVREECATGTASLSLASALLDHQLNSVSRHHAVRFRFEQGINARRGNISVVFSHGKDRRECMHLEGTVFRVMTGRLLFNPK